MEASPTLHVNFGCHTLSMGFFCPVLIAWLEVRRGTLDAPCVPSTATSAGPNSAPAGACRSDGRRPPSRWHAARAPTGDTTRLVRHEPPQKGVLRPFALRRIRPTVVRHALRQRVYADFGEERGYAVGAPDATMGTVPHLRASPFPSTTVTRARKPHPLTAAGHVGGRRAYHAAALGLAAVSL